MAVSYVDGVRLRRHEGARTLHPYIQNLTRAFSQYGHLWSSHNRRSPLAIQFGGLVTSLRKTTRSSFCVLAVGIFPVVLTVVKINDNTIEWILCDRVSGGSHRSPNGRVVRRGRGVGWVNAVILWPGVT